MSTEADYTPADLIEDAMKILERVGPGEEGFKAIGELLQRLGRQPGLLSEGRMAGLHGSAATATILAEDASGHVLMLARFPSEAPTPVHNHGSWGVAHVVKGHDRYSRWERLDDGSDPAKAKLRLAETLELGPGDTIHFGEPPDDIHAQQGIDDAAWELVLFGRNPNARPRAYFDPETGYVTYADAAR